MACALRGFVIGVERGTHQEEGRDAAGHIGYVARFLLGESAAQQCLFAIAEPLLDDLISAEGVLPDSGRNVAPEGFAVEIDVVGGSAEPGGGIPAGFGEGGEFGRRVGPNDRLAFARHGDAALAAMSPAGGEIEVASVGIELGGGGSENADDAEFRANGRHVDGWKGLFDIEERRDLTSERGGGMEQGG